MLAPGFVVGNHGGQSDPTGFLAVAPAQPLGTNGLKRHAAAHQIEVAEIPERRVVWGQKRAATLGVLATIVGGLEEQRPSYPSRPMGLARPDKVCATSCGVIPVDLAKQEKKLRKLEQKAEECLTREQAQKIIRKAEKAQRKINDAEAS